MSGIRTVRGLCCRVPSTVKLSRPALGFVAAIVLESILLLSLAVAILADPAEETQAVVYGLMSLFSVLFWLYMGLDSVLTENRVEYWAANAAGVLFTIFITWEFAIHKTGLGMVWTRLRLAALIVRVSFQFFHIVLFHFVDREFGWGSYSVVGVDVALQAIYERYRGFVSLLRVDLFCFVLLLVLARFFLLDSTSPEFIVGLVAACFMVVFSILGWWSITYENTFGTVVFILGATVQPAYVAYRLFDLATNKSQLPSNVTVPQFCVIGGLFLIARALLLGFTIHLWRKFGRGLKEHLLAFSRKDSSAFSIGSKRLSGDETFLDGFSDISSHPPERRPHRFDPSTLPADDSYTDPLRPNDP